MVVDHLERLFADNDQVVVVCIYCNYKEQSEQRVENLAASLLKQTFRMSGENFANLKALHNRRRKSGTRPTLDELSRLLTSEVQTYSKVFIIVDALAEC